MPIYDYRCDHCGHVFSAVGGFNDPAIDVCPNCGKKPRRLIVAPAVVFKGSGWYKTDSRGAAPKESDGGSSPAKDDKKEEKKETKSDAKPAASESSKKSEASS